MAEIATKLPQKRGEPTKGMRASIGVAVNFTEADLVACIPHLRAFARLLAGNRDRADDLAQDTIVRALTAAHQFQAGTNLKAWMFTILRNLHYSGLRKSRMRLQSLDDMAPPEATAAPSQEIGLEFGDFRRAFRQLGDNQREALILVGASGLSYEEAAKVCNCPPGTIKSRVSRARGELLRILEDGVLTGKRRDTPALAGYIGDPLDSRRANHQQLGPGADVWTDGCRQSAVRPKVPVPAPLQMPSGHHH